MQHSEIWKKLHKKNTSNQNENHEKIIIEIG